MNPWEACLKKKRYNTEDDAKVAGALQEIYDSVKLGTYKCQRCNKWHLTKRDAKGLLGI